MVLRPGEGVLPRQELVKLWSERAISSKYTLEDSQFQPASLDLRLGEQAYRVQCSFLPEKQRVEDKLLDYFMYAVDLRDGGILEPGAVYLIPLVERLKLPEHILGKANPRSSTGRLDIFTRLVSDYNPRFDEIEQGYEGPLYVQLISRSFTIRVSTGQSLNQIRFMSGDVLCSDPEIETLHKTNPLLFLDEAPVGFGEIVLRGGLFLRLDLNGPDAIGYMAKKNSPLLDLARINHYDILQFWAPIFSDAKGRLTLSPEDFYLLCSKEKVRIPPEYAAEMVAYEPASGELRTHYAGFVDPGFGFSGAQGTTFVLEVRAHDVPFVIEDGQRFCKLQLERMMSTPDRLYGPDLGSAYQYQALTPSKHFRSIQRAELRKRVARPADMPELPLSFPTRPRTLA